MELATFKQAAVDRATVRIESALPIKFTALELSFVAVPFWRGISALPLHFSKRPDARVRRTIGLC